MVHGRAVCQEDMERAVTWTAISDSGRKKGLTQPLAHDKDIRWEALCVCVCINLETYGREMPWKDGSMGGEGGSPSSRDF